MTGCAPGAPAPAIPARPARLPAPGPPRPADLPEDPAPALPPDPTTRTAWDELLASPWVHHAEIEARVDHWISVWSGPGADALPAALERMAAYRPLVDDALRERGLPPSLRHLPLVESAYRPGAVSGAAAVGVWQFTEATARGYGLEVGPLVDERRDPVRATRAAADYLAALHERFGSWLLALAAYNAGPTRVDRLLDRHAPGAPPGDGLFLVLRPHLPRETREFVPRFLAVVRVARDPASFGVAAPAPAAPFAYEEVRVPDATSLDVVARAAGTDEAVLLRLNPHLVRGVTPPGRSTTVRVPRGTSSLFRAAYAAVPPEERVTVEEHRVEAGETLWGLARRYGVSLAALRTANPSLDPRRMRPGRRILVPTAPGAERLLAARAAAERDGRYVVGPGDSLREIARRYGVSEEALARWNRLGREAVLRPGQALRVRDAG